MLINRGSRRGPGWCWGWRFVFFILVLMVVGFPGGLKAELYFKDTDQQLEVIRIKGEKPGLTVLIFGGIHGDEPGGYFSSEILSKIKLHKGNLIIVPRVNFPSIMLNRREIYGDMNRKFVPQHNPNDPEAGVVKLLKGLMGEADVFINQHDAGGFHRETYISKKYNPTCYGQSLIIDCASFYSHKLGKTISLGEIGQRIMKRVNEQIENPDHHFGFWDHNSLDKQTRFPEMRKSATYYALTTYSIPAFGLETSKDLPSLSYKVKYQLLVIKEILREFDLEFIFPAPDVEVPLLYWVEFLKNGKDIIRVNGNTNLRLAPGDRLELLNIYANYQTGLSADILGWGTLNDVKKEYSYRTPTVIEVKKNHLTMGLIYLKDYSPQSLQNIEIDINGKSTHIPNWGKIEIGEGEYFKILKTEPGFSQTRFDVRGYSAGPGQRDDSGVKIELGDLLEEYSFDRRGRVYYVKIFTSGQFAGGFQVEVKIQENNVREKGQLQDRETGN